MRFLCAVLAFVMLNVFCLDVFAQVCAEDFKSQTHPRVFATEADRSALMKKMRENPWAAEMYQQIKARVDEHVKRHITDPEYNISRMQMNWQEGERHVNFYTEGNFIPRRSGNAPYPTVRVMYGRAAPGSVPMPPLEKLTPYSSTGDMPCKKGDEWVIVPFEKTQLGVENVHQWFVDRAYDASIVYYITGRKAYAKFAADILWTLMRGASYQNEINPDQGYCFNGYLSFETLGDTRRFSTLPLAYDFIYDYLKEEYFDSDEFKNGRPGELWAPGHKQGKQWAWDRIHIFFEKFLDNKLNRGGGLKGNWNMNEQQSAILYALALDNDDQYADGKGREYYVNKLIYGPTTQGHGAYMDVAKGNLNAQTGLWPEPPSVYGQSSISQLVRFGYWYFYNGIDVLGHEPLLYKAATSFTQMAFPNGRSTGWGDGGYSTLMTDQAELMVAYARAKGDNQLEDTFTSLLKFTGDRRFSGAYYSELFFYVPKLKEVKSTIQYPRTSYSPDHSIIFGRNIANTPRDSLAYTVYGYGDRSGHRHNNGMSAELYGRGYILGVDPGAGQDYWVDQHERYNCQVAAHNCVIPNGSAAGNKGQDLEIMYSEPEIVAGVAPKTEISKLCQFTDTYNRFQGSAGAADQRRVMGIVRTAPSNGYYVDVYRSKMLDGKDKYHDYLYHNMGNSLKLYAVDGADLKLTDDQLDEESGHGYEYFQDDKSLAFEDDFYGLFNYAVKDIQMKTWVLGNADRVVYNLTGPNNFRYYINSLTQYRVPTLLVRQNGQAWDKPFIAVYEPYGDGTNSKISKVRRMKNVPLAGDFVGLAVEHSAGRADYVVNSAAGDKEYDYEGVAFKGIYGVATMDNGKVDYLYLGTGEKLTIGDWGIYSRNGKTVKACLGYDEPARNEKAFTGFVYSSDSAVTLKFPYPAKADISNLNFYFRQGDGSLIPANSELETSPGKTVAILKAPAGANVSIYIK